MTEKSQLWLLIAISLSGLSSFAYHAEQDAGVKTWVLESDRPGFKSYLWHLRAACLWSSYFWASSKLLNHSVGGNGPS